MASLVSVNTSETKGVRKTPVGEAKITTECLKGDAHSGDWHRMVSLLAQESIDKMVKMGLDVGPGDFGENLTTEGVDLLSLPLGARFTIGGGVTLEMTQHGKECHDRCAIYHQAGDCVMPREGVFAKVVSVGEVKVGDKIEVLD